MKPSLLGTEKSRPRLRTTRLKTLINFKYSILRNFFAQSQNIKANEAKHNGTAVSGHPNLILIFPIPAEAFRFTHYLVALLLYNVSRLSGFVYRYIKIVADIIKI